MYCYGSISYLSQEYVSEGKPEELSPATFTHTDRIGNNQQVATFSPMLCEKGSINLFGVSLSCEDEPTNFDFGGKGIDPYRPVAEDESIGAIAMPPADFQKLVEMGSHESLKEGYGLASTALAHTKGGNGVVYPNDSRISAPKKKMKARKNTKRPVNAARISCMFLRRAWTLRSMEWPLSTTATGSATLLLFTSATLLLSQMTLRQNGTIDQYGITTWTWFCQARLFDQSTRFR